jgi:UDP-N-acetylmuramate--alanine ligase
LRLNPLLAVITNVDNDHLSNYENNFNNLKKAFLDFIHRLPFYGLLVACKDDQVACGIIQDISRSVLTYGFSEQADIRAINYKQQENISSFQVILPGESKPKEVKLNLPGRHNVLNALAAIAVSLELNIDFSVIAEALEHFHGTDRRFQIHGNFLVNGNKLLLIDDYGHHPREISAVINAIKSGWPKKRLVVVFQPHRYSRTNQLFWDFIQALSFADYVILLDIYSAGENNISGISSNRLSEELGQQLPNRVICVPNQANLEDALILQLKNIIQNEDILLMQGAGDVGKLTKKLVSKLELIKEKLNA